MQIFKSNPFLQKSLLSCICFLFLFGCKTDAPPLSMKQMSSILLDLHLAEAYAHHLPKDSMHRGLKNEDTLLYFNAQILKDHKTTQNELQTSLAWYQSRPELLDSIYEQVMNELSVRESKLQQK